MRLKLRCPNHIELQSWTKVLEQTCTFGAFAHTPDAITTSLVWPLPPPHIQFWKLAPEISRDFQHCIGWGGGTAKRFSKDSSDLFKLVKHIQFVKLRSLRLLSTIVALNIPRIHINTWLASIICLITVTPILSEPYLYLLFAWHRRYIKKIAENEPWRYVGSSINTVKVLFVVTTTVCLQVSSRWQNGFFLCIGNDSH